MKKIKNEGITLIVLIVTVIILLILVGVTIMALADDNGLINKISISRKKQLESKTEEKLKLKIMELQTDIIEKEGRQASLNDLNNWINQESNYYDSEITSVTDNQENTNKLVEIGGYIFEVDKNLNIMSIVDANKTSISETTYHVNSIDGNVMQVTIKIKNTLGIEKVITPTGKEIVPQIDKTQIGIDYEVISGNNYIFKVKTVGAEEIKEYILKADVNAKPEINQNESYAYPLLNEYGIEVNKYVEIDYGENANNYYSIDNGKTWEKYTGKVKIQKECTLIAKTVIDGEITREDKKKITFELADDAVGSEAYDNNDETGYTIKGVGNHYIEVNEEMIGESFIIKMKSPGNKSNYTKIQLIDENNAIISTIYNGYNVGGIIDNIYKIEENTKYINIYTISSANETIIYEINVENSPKIIENTGYATITKSGIGIIKNSIEIKYFKTSEEKLYKINDEEWKKYAEILTVAPGKLIQAKGIDPFGNETRTIATYTTSVRSDTIGSEAYDNNDETGYVIKGVGNHYIEVSEEMIGESFRIKMRSPGNKSNYTKIQLIDKNNTIMSTIYNGYNVGRVIDNIYKIQENTKYINIYTISTSNTTIIYEIQPK